MATVRNPERYFASVLTRALDEIRSAGPGVDGGRNMVLLKCASQVFSMATALRRAGVQSVPANDVMARELVLAGVASGMNGGEKKARTQVRRAETYGEANPADVTIDTEGKAYTRGPAHQRPPVKPSQPRWAPVEPEKATGPELPARSVLRALWDCAAPVSDSWFAGEWAEAASAELGIAIEQLDLARYLSPPAGWTGWRAPASWDIAAPKWSSTGELVGFYGWSLGEAEQLPGPGILADPLALGTLQMAQRHPVADGRVLVCDASVYLHTAADDDLWQKGQQVGCVGVGPDGMSAEHAARLATGFHTFILSNESRSLRDRLAAALAPHGRVLEF